MLLRSKWNKGNKETAWFNLYRRVAHPHSLWVVDIGAAQHDTSDILNASLPGACCLLIVNGNLTYGLPCELFA